MKEPHMKDRIMLDPSTVIRRNDRVEYRSLGDGEGGVLLHLGTAAYHGVNEVGALVWKSLEGVTFPQLVDEVRAHLASTPPSLEADIADFVGDLVERDLVSYESSADTDPV
jgi:hypothetical protein